MNALTVRACAKLNLTLDVTGRRPDGYHDVRMVMQSVDLCDTLTVSLGGEGIAVDCGSLSGEDNLAYRAAVRYRDAACYEGGVHIAVEKRIPVCGGMGGGSADAAAVLAALDRLIGVVPHDALERIALSLGADVPFALTGGTALAAGVGERLRPLPHLPDCAFLLVSVGEKPSTGAMFARLDQLSDRAHPDVEEVARAITAGDLPAAARGFANSFAPLWDNELSRAARRQMTENGALSVSLSGAGPTIFGTFADAETARNCQTAMGEIPTILCRPARQSLFFE